MTAALLLSIDISRKLKGECKQTSSGLVAKDGSGHRDCSTCLVECGKWDDLGMADSGYVIVRDIYGLLLKWHCPSCGRETTERTELFSANSDAKAISTDPICSNCRANKN